MVGMYVITDYRNAGDETPRISIWTGNLEEAEARFNSSAWRRVQSVVLCYYTPTEAVLKMAIYGEPIYLVKAIEKARKEFELNSLFYTASRIFAENIAALAIEAIVLALTGVRVPGVGRVIVSQFCHPCLERKRDGSTRPHGVVVGGASGTALGFLAGGPLGALLCGVTGAVAGALSAPSVVESFSQPKRKCTLCRGAGLVADFRRCSYCDGKGYLQ